MNTIKKRLKLPILLAGILLISFVSRIYYVSRINGVSGGDFFDFLLITEQLVSFKNPFISKRLPFYPLLLIPGHLAGNPLVWAKIMGILFALASLYVLFLIGRKLNINRWALYLALMLSSFQGYLFIFSLKPLTHTLFNLEVLLSLYLLYLVLDSGSESRNIVWFGVVLGIASMTRLEGFIVAAVLLPLMFAYQLSKKDLRHALCRFLYAVIPFILIVAPFFISNVVRYGNLLYTEYYEDRGVYRATSIQELQKNYEATKWVILGLWGKIPIAPIKSILIPVVGVVLAVILIRDSKIGAVRIVRKLKIYYLFLIFGMFYYWVILNRVPFEGDIRAFGNFFIASLMFTGAVKLFLDSKFRSIPLFFLVFSQTLFLLVVQPWGRHLQHTYPFYALFLGLGISWLLNLKDLKFRNLSIKGVNYIMYLLLFAHILFNLYAGIEAGVRGHNKGILEEKPLMDAAVYVRDSTSGRVGFESDASWIRYYVGDRAVYFTTKLEIPPENKDYIRPDSEQIKWVRDNKLDFVVNYSEWDGLSLVRNPSYSGSFILEKEFLTERDGKGYQVKIYKVIL